MTEIPEHLLARSKARRSAMGGGGGDDAPAAATPAKADAGAPEPAVAAAAPAVAAAAAPAPKAAPTPPWVTAAQSRKKIPFWAVPVLALLPLWAVIYALTLDPPTNAESPLTVGATTYSTNCATCHGATGGGSGNIPALAGADGVLKSFPKPADQVAWVALGSAGWLQAGQKALPGGRPVSGGMPSWQASLQPADLMSVVLHERATLNDEKFDATKWEDGFEETLKKYVPDQAAAYKAVLDSWKATPPA
ncbi:MAG: cytochrome c [Actinobacteria bacterium]|nr:cytochrome c [Actinomycetota bacterium]